MGSTSLFSGKKEISQCRYLIIMKFTIATFVVLATLATSINAICPGFNYGIGNKQALGNGVNRCK